MNYIKQLIDDSCFIRVVWDNNDSDNINKDDVKFHLTGNSVFISDNSGYYKEIDYTKLTAPVVASALLLFNAIKTFADTNPCSSGGGGSGDLLAANNLSDLSDIPTARNNLGVQTLSEQQQDGTALVPYRQPITALQAQTLSSVPVDIADLPAPGVGYAWEIISMSFKYTFVSADYDFTSVSIKPETAIDQFTSVYSGTGASVFSNGTIRAGDGTTNQFAENKKMQLYSDVDPTVGDGTLVFYGAARKITL